jgi:hypothetical protein
MRALGGAGLLEHEVRFGLCVGRLVGRRLIEEEVALGRATGRRDRRSCVWHLEMQKAWRRRWAGQ